MVGFYSNCVCKKYKGTECFWSVGRSAEFLGHNNATAISKVEKILKEKNKSVFFFLNVASGVTWCLKKTITSRLFSSYKAPE